MSTKALAELVSIPTDTVPLDGLYYEPVNGPVRGAAMIMHGNGMNFYYGASGFLPPHLVAAGFACLAFNRRGHDTVSARTREPEGNAFQTAAQARADNEFARHFLLERGHGAPVLVGHSNGGMLAAEHAAYHHDTPALVLLSAHCGGPEMVRRASAQGLLGGPRLSEISAQAHALVDDGRPDELLLMPGWWYVTSAAAFVDMEVNVPVLLDSAAQITCPTLFFRGSVENAELYPAEQFAKVCPADVDVRIIDDCDHFYGGHESDVGGQMADWLAKQLPGDRA